MNMRRLFQRIKRVSLPPATASLFAVALRALAAGDTWTGGGAPDGNWQTAANWGGAAPVAGDLLNFDTSTQTSATNNFANGTVFGNLGFNSTAGAFTLWPVIGGDGSGVVVTNRFEDSNGVLYGGSVS